MADSLEISENICRKKPSYWIEGGGRHGISPELSRRAGGPEPHRRGGVPVCPAQPEGLQPLRPLPVPLGKDRLLLRRPGKGHLLLLRLPQGRRRHQLHHGDREPRLPRRRPVPRQAGWDGGPRRRGLPVDLPPPGAALGPLQGRGPVFPRQAGRGLRRRGQGLHRKAWPLQGDRHPLRPRLRPGQLVGPDRRHGQKGLREAGPAGRRSGPEIQGKGDDLRPVPQPAHVPDHRRPGQCHRLRGPGYGRFDAQVPQLPGDRDLQQAQKPLRYEHRQEEQAGPHHPDRGLHGRHRPPPVRL